MKSAWLARAISEASVVFPAPGGPHKIIDDKLPAFHLRAQRFAHAQECVPGPCIRSIRAGAYGLPAAGPLASSSGGNCGGVVSKRLNVALAAGPLHKRQRTRHACIQRFHLRRRNAQRLSACQQFRRYSMRFAANHQAQPVAANRLGQSKVSPRAFNAYNVRPCARKFVITAARV